MLRLLSVLILCLLFSFEIKGDQEFYQITQYKGIIITAPPDFQCNEGGGMKKISLFWLLLNINKELCSDTAFIEINFNLYKSYTVDNIFPIKGNYFLGWNNRTFWHCDRKGNPIGYINRHAVVLNVNTDSVNISDCLKLIVYGLQNKSEIINIQETILGKHNEKFSGTINSPYDFIRKSLYGNIDFLKTIPQKKINEILQSRNDFVKGQLNSRIYRKWTQGQPETYGILDLYCQKDSFFVYEKTDSFINQDKKHSEKEVLALMKKVQGSPRFSIPSLYHISSDFKDNYLFFIGNRTFIYYNATQNKIRGPFVIPQLNDWCDKKTYINDTIRISNDSMIIRLIPYWEQYSYNVIYNKKIGIVAIDTNTIDSNLKKIISNIEKRNSSDQQIKKQVEISYFDPTNESSKRTRKILILLGISILLNGFLIYKARK